MVSMRTDRLILILILMTSAFCLWHQSSGSSPSLRVQADASRGGDRGNSIGADTVRPSEPASVTIQLTTTKTGPFVYKVCAHVLSDGHPYKGMIVDFEVPSGPHKGKKFRGQTDEKGDVCWTVEGDGQRGTDTVDGTSEGETDTITFDWTTLEEQMYIREEKRRRDFWDCS